MPLDLMVECLHGEARQLTLRRPMLIMAGFAGRDQAKVQQHIDELVQEGVPAPESVPTYYRVPEYLLVGPGEYDVVGERTSGEAEPVLVVTESGVYVGVGSDHTDRDAERQSVAMSKLLGPKVMGTTVWPVEDVKEYWDELILEGWSGGMLYQRGVLADLLHYAAHPLERMRTAGRDLVLFLGTLPVIGGKLGFAAEFAGSLRDPRTSRSLSFAYRSAPQRQGQAERPTC